MKNYKNLEKLFTKFGETIDKRNPLPEYPRPQFERDSFLNLNGYWDYAILKKHETLGEYQGKILVPFSPECPLSEVNRLVMPNDILYYKHDFEVKKGFLQAKTFLHFGAVDYKCNVYLNGKHLGEHKGGYFPFNF